MLRFFVVSILALWLVGCVTPRVKQSQTQELQNRIITLERELQAKDEQMRILEDELYQKEAKPRQRTKIEDIPAVTPKRIQLALKNAGFYKGSVDGNIGHQTRQAIKEFQRANGLKADGIVGRRTWEKLSKYLN